MDNGSRYVPPHLRGNNSNTGLNPSATSFEPTRNNNTNNTFSSTNDARFSRGGDQEGREYRAGGFQQNREYSSGGGYNNNHYNGGGYGGGGYGGGGGYRGRGGGGGGGDFGGYSRYSNRGPRKNELGFHGSMKEDKVIESQLFSGQVATGINFDKYDDIPVETSGFECPSPISTFDEADLPASLRHNLTLCGFSRPTPIQKHAIPIGLSQRDMMACAQTGSGKTGGFLFPVLTVLLQEGPSVIPEDNTGVRSRKSLPNALILAPTRELASQINDEALKFSYATGIQPVCVYGGADIREQMRLLDQGCDVLVATPGRLVDLIERGRISLSSVKFLVLDEADRMLDMGFEPQIRRIVMQEDLPRTRRTFMFSATFPKEIQRLASDFLDNYVFITVGRVGSAASDILQKIEYCSDETQKPPSLMRYLSQVSEGLVLVFVETKKAADLLEHLLQKEGYPTTSIHGDRSQGEREEALALFKSGRKPILVATDVAARGLDIANVGFVINYDMPSNIDDYVHRIGRTGRAGNKGTAISMMSEKNKGIAKELFELLSENNQTVPPWLKQMATTHSYGSGGRGRGGGGRGRGGYRDYREPGNSFGGRGGGGRGGHSGGHANNNNNTTQSHGSNSQSWNRGGAAMAPAPRVVSDDAW